MSATVRPEHVRAAGYCMRGVRRWLAQHGRTMTEFVEGRIDTSWLRATGDSMAAAVAEIAERRAQERGDG